MTKRSSDDLTMDSNIKESNLNSVSNGFTIDDNSDVAQKTTASIDICVVENNNNNNNNEISKKVKLENNAVVDRTAALTTVNTVTTADNCTNATPTNQRPQQTTTQSNALSNVKSRVVHVRNIPVDTNETDLFGLGLSFGRITNCLILRGKSQAFVEFSEQQSAQQMVNYWSQTTVAGVATPMQPTIRGRHVFCQLSNHKELKTNNHNNNQNNNNNQNQNNNSSQHSFNNHNSSGGAGDPSHDGQTVGQSSPSCVIRVVVENLLYAVSLDVLHSVFSRAGKVAKIVTFTKNGSFQALIQFCENSNAIQAKQVLDGQNLFPNANTLRIEFSKLQQLNVKYNNDKSRDYTNPSLPSMTSQHNNHNNQSLNDVMNDPNHAQQSLMSSLLSASAANSGHHSAASAAAQQLFASNMNPFHAMTATAHSLRALNPLLQLGVNSASAHHMASGLGGIGGALGLGGAMGHNGIGMGGQSAVLLVSNLNESTTTTDALFTLFGVYGDVIRVKILFNKKDNALVQMAEPAQAQLAQTYLDKVKLSGRVIRVTQSKHQLVQMPKEGQHDAGLTKDYSSSALHRFKKPGSKNYGNIYPPSATLHLSNIPSCVSEEDIRSAFNRETGCPVVAFKFFPKDRKMALIQMQSIDDSIQALIAMHNYQLSESSHLRVSFSKSSI